MRRYLQILFSIFCFLIISKGYSQIVGSNAFMQGTYVNIGVNDCGAYGSNSPPPAGYYYNVFSGLGFTADSDMDGWTTGTPDYCGDYFVPGSPVEGWAVQVGASVYVNTDQYCSPSDVPGSVTDYSYASGVYTTVWEGNIGSEDLAITQTTTLPEDKLYFVTRILLCNEGPTDLTDVYYMRNVDPDNDQPWSGDFTTDNTIVYQPPTDPDALVTSVGLTYGCFLGLGSRDINSRVAFGNFATTAGTPKNVWDGTAGYSSSGGQIGDIANSISFYIPVIPAGECACIAFAYILNADDLDEALDATSAVGVAADGVDITSSGLTSVCPGDSVTLTILNADGYDWTWSPGTGLNTTTGDSVISSPPITTTYTATGVGICGVLEREVTVEVFTPPVADAGPDKGLCPGDSVQLEGSGGVTYEWLPPVYLDDNTLQNPTVIAPQTSMYYFIEASDSNGCKDEDTVFVELYPLPQVDAGPDKVIVKGGFTQLLADGAVTYEWTPPDFLSNAFINDPIANPDDTITYYVTGTDANGCINTDSVTVFVLDPVYIVSPNAFTPNGDELNDVFMPTVIGPGQILDFQVFDRWGKLMFDWDNISRGWDGTFQGKPQEIGTYIVVIKALDILSGKQLDKNGTLILMK